MKYFPSALPLGFFFYSFSQPAFVSKHFQVQTKLWWNWIITSILAGNLEKCLLIKLFWDKAIYDIP